MSLEKNMKQYIYSEFLKRVKDEISEISGSDTIIQSFPSSMKERINKINSQNDLISIIGSVAKSFAKNENIASLKLLEKFSKNKINENVSLLKDISETRKELRVMIGDFSIKLRDAHGIKDSFPLIGYTINWNPLGIMGTLLSIEEKYSLPKITEAIISSKDPEATMDSIIEKGNFSDIGCFVSIVANGFEKIERNTRKINKNIKRVYNDEERKELSQKNIPWINEQGEILISHIKLYPGSEQNYKNFFINMEETLKEKKKIEKKEIDSISLFDYPIEIKSNLVDSSSEINIETPSFSL